MDLSTYLSRPGAVVELARAIDAHASLVSQLKNGRRAVPARFCPKIEKATGGLVTCEEMLPDVDWTYLRGTSTVNPENTQKIEPEPHVECCSGDPRHSERRRPELRTTGDRREDEAA